MEKNIKNESLIKEIDAYATMSEVIIKSISERYNIEISELKDLIYSKIANILDKNEILDTRILIESPKDNQSNITTPSEEEITNKLPTVTNKTTQEEEEDIQSDLISLNEEVREIPPVEINKAEQSEEDIQFDLIDPIKIIEGQEISSIKLNETPKVPLTKKYLKLIEQTKITPQEKTTNEPENADEPEGIFTYESISNEEITLEERRAIEEEITFLEDRFVKSATPSPVKTEKKKS